MYSNLLEYCENKSINVFDIVPLTFLLEVDSPNYSNDLDNFMKYFSFTEQALEKRNNFGDKSKDGDYLK